MSKPEFFLWVDLETTGLNPRYDFILEMALVLTDADFNEIGRGHFLFSPTINFADVNEHVKEMHTKNGLWADVINKPTTMLETANRQIMTWINDSTQEANEAFSRINWDQIYLAGSSVHFDVGFLREKRFAFVGEVSHRYFDVSVFRTAVKLWSPSKLYTQNATHRAMDDILDHIEEAKYYRRVLS